MELYSTYGYSDPEQDCYLDALPDRNIGYLICMKNRTKACTHICCKRVVRKNVQKRIPEDTISEICTKNRTKMSMKRS